MRVLHLISGGDVGGAKVQVITLVKALQKENIDVKLICFMPGIFYDEARKEGLNIELLEQSSRFDFSVLKEIRGIIQEENYNLLHSHGARANLLSMLLRADIPVVTTLHSDYLMDFNDNFFKKIVFTPLNMLSLRYMDHYITISPELQETIIERGFPRDKTSFVFNGLDFDREVSCISREEFLSSKGVPFNSQAVYAGILARLHPIKGHEVFLKGAARVLKSYENVRFIMGGDGSQKNELESLARKLNIENYVFFIGFVDNPYDFFNAIDINILTSYHETFPYALLEGAKMKKPSISSRVGGIPQLIIEGKTGYLFESGDDSELAEKMELLLESRERRLALGEALYKLGREKYSCASMAKQFIEIYHKVIKKVMKNEA